MPAKPPKESNDWSASDATYFAQGDWARIVERIETDVAAWDAKEESEKQQEGFPTDTESHIKAALSYFNQGAGKAERSPTMWAKVGRRIAAACTRLFGKPYRYAAGKIITPDATKADADAMMTRLRDAAKKLPQTDGYGQVHYHPESQIAHYCGSDCDSEETLQEAERTLSAVEGVKQVKTDAEYSPCGDAGWQHVRCTKATGDETNVWAPDTGASGPYEFPNVGNAVGDPPPAEPIDKNSPFFDPNLPHEEGCPCPYCQAKRQEGAGGAVAGESPIPSEVSNNNPSADGVACADSFACEEEICFVGGDSFSIVSDDAKGLCVRQLMTLANRRNLNRRIYPTRALQPAVDDARKRARAGAMLMELKHPEVGVTSKGEKRFFDMHDRKTARVDDIKGILSDDTVWADICCLLTPAGQRVAQAYRDGKPYGTSIRLFITKAHKAVSDGMEIDVADEMEIPGFDHVDNPAVPTTQQQYTILTDSARADLGLPAANLNPNPAGHAERRKFAMNERIRKALNDAHRGIREKKDKKTVLDLRAAVADEIRLSDRAQEDTIEASERLTALDETMRLAGYMPERPDPSLTPGNDPSDDPRPGWAGEIERTANTPEMNPSMIEGLETIEHGKMGTRVMAVGKDGLTADDVAFLRAERARQQKAVTDAERQKNVQGEIAKLTIEGGVFAGLDSGDQEYLLSITANLASQATLTATDTIADVVGTIAAAQMDAFMKRVARHRLAGGGYDPNASTRGNTIQDAAAPGFVPNAAAISSLGHIALDEYFQEQGTRPPEGMRLTVGMLRATDAFYDNAPETDIVPGDKATISRRKRNILKVLKEVVPGYFGRDYNPTTNLANEGRGGILGKKQKFASFDEWFRQSDALTRSNGSAQALTDEFLSDKYTIAGGDAISSVNAFANQASVSLAILLQTFQDLTLFDRVKGIGPVLQSEAGGGPGWFNFPGGNEMGFGALLAIPTNWLNEAAQASWAGPIQRKYDPGLQVPEGSGIPNTLPRINWQYFQPVPRRISAIITRDAIMQMGHGPLNFSLLPNHFYWGAFRKLRTIDKAIGDEMWRKSGEYNCVVVSSGETPNLTNNSVYSAGPTLTVNLNPQKAANAAVVPPTSTVIGDMSVTYGTNSATANVVGAIRLQTGGNGSSAPFYAGGVNGNDGFSPIPIVAPRTIPAPAANGITTTTLNPFVVIQTGTGATQVAGYLDDTGAVQAYPLPDGASPVTPNWALDRENGVIVFTAAYTGLVASSTILANNSGDTTTFTYSFETNYDKVQSLNLPAIAYANSTQPYIIVNQLIAQMDQTAAIMGSHGSGTYGRYVKPTHAVTDLFTSADLVNAALWYKLNSPDGTVLYPDEDTFGQHNGIAMCRTNCPWELPDRRGILLFRDKTTCYGIDTLIEVRGPQFAPNATGLPIAQETWFMEEFSVVCTPLTQDNNGNVINSVHRAIYRY